MERYRQAAFYEIQGTVIALYNFSCRTTVGCTGSLVCELPVGFIKEGKFAFFPLDREGLVSWPRGACDVCGAPIEAEEGELDILKERALAYVKSMGWGLWGEQ